MLKAIFSLFKESADMIKKFSVLLLAFVSANLEKPEDDEIIVFAPENYGEYDEKDIPGKMILWIDSLITYKNGIKFKHFSHK